MISFQAVTLRVGRVDADQPISRRVEIGQQPERFAIVADEIVWASQPVMSSTIFASGFFRSR